MQKDFMSQFNVSSLYLKRFALKLTRDESNASDLYQETAYQAFRNRKRFKSGTNMKAWLSTIMKNIFINNFRKKKSREKKVEVLHRSKSEMMNGSSALNAGELNLQFQELVKIVDSLESNFKEPFLLAYQGYSYEEISKQVGNIPIGTVKSRIFFARNKLKKKIQELYN